MTLYAITSFEYEARKDEIPLISQHAIQEFFLGVGNLDGSTETTTSLAGHGGVQMVFTGLATLVAIFSLLKSLSRLGGFKKRLKVQAYLLADPLWVLSL